MPKLAPCLFFSASSNVTSSVVVLQQIQNTHSQLPTWTTPQWAGRAVSALTAGSTKSGLARSILNDSPMGVGTRRFSWVNFFAGSRVERASCLAPGHRTGPRIHARSTRTTTRMAPRKANTKVTQPTFPRPFYSGPLPLKSRDPQDPHRLRRLLTMPTPTLLRSHISQTFPVIPSSTRLNLPSPRLLQQAQTSPSMHEVSPRVLAYPTHMMIRPSSRRPHKTHCKCTNPASGCRTQRRTTIDLLRSAHAVYTNSRTLRISVHWRDLPCRLNNLPHASTIWGTRTSHPEIKMTMQTSRITTTHMHPQPQPPNGSASVDG